MSEPQRDRDQTPAAAAGSGGVASAATAVHGAVGEGSAAATRSGEDSRRRGWFWHWNSLVTQYAPLIGLKGVGLVNSYTVWTDRREESPHRGYAFPSQQREADFYGEDRAELIAINKILVALDLIEIRKEMVLRADEQGRKWRVPHNFYRVKDHDDSFALSAPDVLRVVELADRDKAVYRYVRRIFSPRFAPIDAANVWTRILPELQRSDAWQRLAARAGAEDSRASARTRAGHAARKAAAGGATGAAAGVPADGDLFVPAGGDTATPNDSGNDSDGVVFLEAPQTIVATTNNGSDPGVGGTNNGSTKDSTTSVAPANGGGPTSVAPANTTYDQNGLTTTTTPTGPANDIESGTPGTAVPITGETGFGAMAESTTPLDNRHTAPDDPAGTGMPPASGGPGGRPAPVDAAGEAAGIRAFEDANARRSTPAERQLLTGLAARFEPTATASPDGPGDGWGWVAAAVYEAVEAGSAFVAPRRLREILARWERDGFPGADGDGPTAEAPSPGIPARMPVRAARSQPAAKPAVPAAGADDPASWLGDGPDLPLPHGFGARRTWAFAVGLLAAAMDRAHLADLVAGTAIVGYRDGEVTLAAPDPAQAERLAGPYRELVARKLGEAMRRPVRLAVLTVPPPDARESNPASGEELGAAGDRADAAPAAPRRAAPPATSLGVGEPEPPVPSFLVAETGFPSGQVWAAVLDELRASGAVSPANLDAWLRPTALIGRGPGGALVVGAPHALARRRVADRFLGPLRAAVAAVAGTPLPVEIVVARDWLRANPGPVRQARDEDVVGA